MWLFNRGFITEGGIAAFLSAFAEINEGLADSNTAKKVRKVSKQNRKVNFAAHEARGCEGEY